MGLLHGLSSGKRQHALKVLASMILQKLTAKAAGMQESSTWVSVFRRSVPQSPGKATVRITSSPDLQGGNPPVQISEAHGTKALAMELIVRNQ